MKHETMENYRKIEKQKNRNRPEHETVKIFENCDLKDEKIQILKYGGKTGKIRYPGEKSG